MKIGSRSVDDNFANQGALVAAQLRAAAEAMGHMAALHQFALADLVAHAVALENGSSTEDELLGAVDQFITICKLPHTRRPSHDRPH